MNSYFFYLGLLKDCPDVLRQMMAIPAKSEGERWAKIINFSNYLLASYATPYNVICEGIVDALVESAKLYSDIINGKYQKSPFIKLPQMHILYIMQRLLRDSYSYGFFKDAMEHAALEIDSLSIDNKLKCYSLFFLNVAYIDIGDGNSFDFLLNAHQDNMPIDLVMAYRHESGNVKDHSELMKRQDKKIKRLFRNNKSLVDEVKKMYDVPVSISSKKQLN